MAFGTAALKGLQTFLYILTFCAAGTVLALYSYFLAEESKNNISIPTKHRAIEGIGGVGVVYSIFAVVLTCCLGHVMIFAFLAILLDIAFVGGFIAIAVMAKDGATSCSGNTVNTPLGNGPPNSNTARNGARIAPTLKTVCHMESAVFAVAIIGAFLFLLSAIVQLFLARHHRKNKAYGPSPGNNYSSGRGNGIRFWKGRGNRNAHHAGKDAELGALGVGAAGVAAHEHHNHHANGTNGVTGVHDNRLSGTTADTYTGNKYETAQVHNNGAGVGGGIPTAGGYHSGPAGAGVNPYGYNDGAAPGGQVRSHNY